MITDLSLCGLGEVFMIDGAVNGELFEAYVEHIFAPTLSPGEIVIMDNLSAHKSKKVRQLIEAKGCQLLFLPAYSPDLSPIEEAFSKVKTVLRRIGARTRESLYEALEYAVTTVTAHDARGWFRHCGYQVPDPIRTNLRAQQPGRESSTQKLSRVGVLFALIHLTAGPHSTSDGEDDIMKRAVCCESFNERKTPIADHLSEFDQTALFILPCKQDNEPMLEQNADQFGIQLAQDPPFVLRAPFVNLPILLPEFVEYFNLPAFSLQNDGLSPAQTFSWCIGEQQKPLAQLQCLF
jgi:transposase